MSLFAPSTEITKFNLAKQQIEPSAVVLFKFTFLQFQVDANLTVVYFTPTPLVEQTSGHNSLLLTVITQIPLMRCVSFNSLRR